MAVRKHIPTIRDVAREAEVSVATVSRILNGLSGYTDDTKGRVLAVIERLGFKRNALASGLVSRKTHTIGVLLPSVSGRFATLLLHGIENAAHSLDYSTIVCNTDNDGARTLEYLQVLGEKQVEGIIYTSEYVKDEYGEAFERMGIPVVLVSTASTKFRLPYVKVDDAAAAYHATKFLLEKGHRRIGMIAGTRTDLIAGVPRVDGFRKALTDAGIQPADNLVAYGSFGFQSGIDAMAALVTQVPAMTAVFAASDEMAVGALAWCHTHGVRVPDQLSVIGYDDTQDAEMAIPPLTTVHQPIYEMGERAARMLLDRKGRAESVVVPFSIIERESVRSIS